MGTPSVDKENPLKWDSNENAPKADFRVEATILVLPATPYIAVCRFFI